MKAAPKPLVCPTRVMNSRLLIAILVRPLPNLLPSFKSGLPTAVPTSRQYKTQPE
jgi:hypothetical protein